MGWFQNPLSSRLPPYKKRIPIMDYENPQYIGQYDPKKISERITVSTGFFNIFHRLAPKFSIPVLPQSRVHKRIPLEDQIAAVPSPAPGFWQKTGNGKASNFMENMFIYIYTHHVLVYIYICILLFQCSVSIVCIICIMCIVSIVCITCIRSYSMYVYIYRYIVQIMYIVCIFWICIHIYI